MKFNLFKKKKKNVKEEIEKIKQASDEIIKGKNKETKAEPRKEGKKEEEKLSEEKKGAAKEVEKEKEEKKEPEVAASAEKQKKEGKKEEQKAEVKQEEKEPGVIAEAEKWQKKYEEKKKLKIKKPDLNKKLSKDFKKIRGFKGKKLLSKRKKTRLSMRGFAKVIDLQSYLEKAGLAINARQLTKKIFMLNIYICLGLSVVALVLNIVFKKGFVNLLVFLLGFWFTVFFLLLALVWAIYLFYLDMKIFNRTRAVEAVFPDFLQLTSSNISAGMPIDRALWYAVRPGFGVLAKEIETVAKNTMAGEDLGAALTNFANKYNSKIIQRSISLLLEGMAAGGEMALLLNKIALNIDETKILKKEMAASVTTYVIFIAFATVLAAPVLFGLATQLLVVIKQITSSMSSNIQASGAFFSFAVSTDSVRTSDFKLFAYMMLIISSFSSACIISVIKKGRVREGLTRIPVFILASVILYALSSIIISSLFGSFI